MLLSIVAVIGFGAVAVSTYAVQALPDDVESSDYAPIVETQALIADVLPPPAYAIEAYACALELVEAEGATELAALCHQVDALHRDLRARHAFWRRTLAPGPIRESFLGPGHRTAEALFDAIEHELIPAIDAGASLEARRALLRTRVQPLYRAHRDAIDVVVARSTAHNVAALASAARAIQTRRLVVTALAVGLVLATLLISWRLRRFLREGLDAQVAAHEATQRAMELAQASERALGKARDELEIRVLERTRELRAILDNVVFGFLTIGADLEAREGYTRSCEELLGTDAITGRSLPALLGLDAQRVADFAINVAQVFDDLLPEEVSLSLLPQRFVLGSRTLRAEARAVRDTSGRIALLLFTLSDMTRLEAAEHENEANRSLLGILRQRPAFDGFLEETKKQLAIAKQTEEEPVVRRVTHTIKGNAAVYGMHPVVRLAHRIEEEATIRPEHIEALGQSFREWLDGHADVLGIHFDGTATVRAEVCEAQLEALHSIATALPSAEATKIHAWIAVLAMVPVRTLLGPIDTLAQQLAGRLMKDVSVVIEGGDVLVDGPRLRSLFAVVPHLVRNALDHGIETPDARGDTPAHATLCIRVTRTDTGALSLVVADDGRGIDADAVAQAAVARGAVAPELAARMTTEEKLALIFLDRVSTKSDVNDISGRGVGMSAVKAEVEALGGRIHLTSMPGGGAAIGIELAA